MPDDRSLDEFAADSTGDGDDAEGGTVEGGDAADTGVTDANGSESISNIDVTAVTPAVPTATWTTDGTACDRCGEPVARRWFDDDAFVCADCKEW